MRLKKITIFGFKSFADKITLDFDSEILGIVGPNGCGKSNIVDAFRWVMGEAHAKSFRADKMQDVLFAGGEKRKPANFAEVTIVLNDIEGALHLPYEELSITRKLFRTGESEYFINKSEVRLKDIQDLLLGSGLGKNAFSVFEQGKLDSVIHLHPLQRRVIFDEAAGTSRFLQRKKESLKRLSHTKENYQRIHDIHCEVEKKVKTLKKQAGQAQAFQETKETLKQLEKNVLLTQWHLRFAKKETLVQKLSELKRKFDEKKESALQLEKELEAIKLKEKDSEKHAQEVQNNLYEKKTKQEIQKIKIQEKIAYLASIEEREKRLLQEKKESKAKGKKEGDDLSEKQNRLAPLLEKTREWEKEVLKRKTSRSQEEKQNSSFRENLAQISASYLHKVEEEKKLHGEVHKRRLQLEAHQEKLQKTAAACEEKRQKIEDLEKESSQKKSAVESLSQEIDSLKKEIDQCEKELKVYRNQIETEKEKRGKLFSKLESVVAKEEALMRLKEQFEGFSAGSKKLLQEAQNEKSPFYKKIVPFSQYIEPKNEDEKFALSALFLYADTLVVENEKVLSKVLAFAKEKKLSNFSLFSLERIKNKKSIREHFLQEVSVCEKPFEIEFLGREQISEDGNFFISRPGVIFSIGARKDVFQREMDLQALTQDKEKLKTELQILDKKLVADLEALQKKEENVRRLTLQHRKKEMSLVQENFALQRSKSDLVKEKKEAEELKKEASKLQGMKEDSRASKMEEAFKEVQSQMSLLLAAKQEIEKALNHSEAALKQASLFLEEAEKELHIVSSEKQKIENEIFLLSAKEKQMQQEVLKNEKELHILKGETAKAQEWIANLSCEMEQNEKEIYACSLLHHQAEKHLKESRQLGEKVQKNLNSVHSEAQGFEKELYKIELQEAEESSKQAQIENELKERYEISSDMIFSEEVILEEGLEAAERKIHELRITCEKIDGINLGAIKEYQEEEERYQFLTGQLNDLETAKNDLEQAIEKLDSECRKIFKKTYEKIRANFHKNFSLLFNGGEADLKFTESADILEAGIEIIAKPPGKQMRSITLLSGGEKCLTALALLFSIFEVKPAPFCILDEVDAPLDDSNVERFSQMIQQYTKDTQFILVTHNKKTMAFADILIGISMEEKGVSKLISLAFEKRNSVGRLVTA